MSVTEKTIQVRLINTHDTETNWQGVESTFTPADGEFIIYSADGNYDYARYKLGDGTKTLAELPFLNTPVFVGTRSEYDSAYKEGKIVNGTVVYITDDESDSGDNSADGSAGVSGVVVSKLPAASSSYRGWTLILAGDDDDVAYICLKKAGNYMWYPITTGSSGVAGEGELPGTGGETTAKLGTAKLGYMVLGQE